MKALSFCIPGHGGMYAALLALRKALALHGVDLRWASAGRSIGQLARQAATAADLEIGTLLAPGTDDDLPRAHALLEHIERERPALLITNVLGGAVETNLVRYVPRSVLRILIVHSISRSTYRAARAIRDWSDATVAISPRIEQDLIRLHGFPSERVCVIPNSLPMQPLAKLAANRKGELRVLSHGRIEHSSKGVNWLPEIVRCALDRGPGFLLTISGEGPDLAPLKTAFARSGLADRVRFLGFVPRERVPEVMREHDVFLLPSIYEGLSLALIEAMAAGCVPIASRIRGVTDFVIAEGETGILFPVGDVRAAANALSELGLHRNRLETMSRAASRSARERFGTKAQGDAFHRLIEQIRCSPRPARAPLSMSNWRMARELRPGWWHALPTPVKDMLRVARERVQFGNA